MLDSWWRGLGEQEIDKIEKFMRENDTTKNLRELILSTNKFKITEMEVEQFLTWWFTSEVFLFLIEVFVCFYFLFIFQPVCEQTPKRGGCFEI